MVLRSFVCFPYLIRASVGHGLPPRLPPFATASQPKTPHSRRHRSAIEAAPKLRRTAAEAVSKRSRSRPEAVPKRCRTVPEDRSNTPRTPIVAALRPPLNKTGITVKIRAPTAPVPQETANVSDVRSVGVQDPRPPLIFPLARSAQQTTLSCWRTHIQP